MRHRNPLLLVKQLRNGGNPRAAVRWDVRASRSAERHRQTGNRPSLVIEPWCGAICGPGQVVGRLLHFIIPIKSMGIGGYTACRCQPKFTWQRRRLTPQAREQKPAMLSSKAKYAVRAAMSLLGSHGRRIGHGQQRWRRKRRFLGNFWS